MKFFTAGELKSQIEKFMRSNKKSTIEIAIKIGEKCSINHERKKVNRIYPVTILLERERERKNDVLFSIWDWNYISYY